MYHTQDFLLYNKFFYVLFYISFVIQNSKISIIFLILFYFSRDLYIEEKLY